MIEPSARRWVMFALLVGVGMASSTAPSPTSRCPPLWCLGSALVAVVFVLVSERPTIACLKLACGFGAFGAVVSVSRFRAGVGA